MKPNRPGIADQGQQLGRVRLELVPRMEFIPFQLILTEAYPRWNEGSKQLRNRILFEICPKPLYIDDHIARILIRKNRSPLERSSSCDLISPPPVQLELREASVGHKEAMRDILQV
jgi:hypothetical protein